MEKVYVEVTVPAIGKKYDFIIPSVMKVGVATELIAKAVCEYEEGINLGRENLILCSKGKDCILKEDITVEKAGIRDGSSLILL